MINQGSDVNHRNKEDQSVLICAAMNEKCHYRTLKLLIDNGAVPRVNRLNNKDVLMNYLTNVEPLQLSAIELLVDAGCNVNHSNNEGKVTLHYAVRNPTVTLEILQYLISKQADVNKVLYNNESVLESYCSYGFTLDREIVSYIIRQPFDLTLLSLFCFRQIKQLIYDAVLEDGLLLVKVMHRLRCSKLLKQGAIFEIIKYIM